MPKSQDAQYLGPEARTAEQLNAAFIKIINYTCAFPAMTCQNFCGEKGPLFLLLDPKHCCIISNSKISWDHGLWKIGRCEGRGLEI